MPHTKFEGKGNNNAQVINQVGKALYLLLFVNISHGLKTKKIWLRETIWLLQMSLYEFFRMEYRNKICIWPKTGLLQPRPTDEIQKRRLNKVENAILKP